MKQLRYSLKRAVLFPVRAFVGWFVVVPFLLGVPFLGFLKSGTPVVGSGVRTILLSPVILVRDEKILMHARTSHHHAFLTLGYFGSLIATGIFGFDALRDYVVRGVLYEVPLILSMLFFVLFAVFCLLTFHETVADD